MEQSPLTSMWRYTTARHILCNSALPRTSHGRSLQEWLVERLTKDGDAVNGELAMTMGIASEGMQHVAAASQTRGEKH